MVGVGKQFEYTMRDEALHRNFGVDLINTLRGENPAVWTDEFEADIDDLIREAVAFESTHAEKARPPDLPGMSAEGLVEYVEYIAARRLTQLGIDEAYGTENPFPWISEAVGLSREANFFERQ